MAVIEKHVCDRCKKEIVCEKGVWCFPQVDISIDGFVISPIGGMRRMAKKINLCNPCYSLFEAFMKGSVIH